MSTSSEPRSAQRAAPSGDVLADTLAHVEAHLFAPLSVAQLADRVGLSPYHFSRCFTARLGESVMGYVRARRMEAAAVRLMGADPPPLVELAFDCGFESQEAFTRAFRRRFGAPPGQFQRNAPAKEHLMPNTAAHVVEMDTLVRLEAFTVAGVSAVFDDENKSGIPGLWPRLIKCLPLAGQVGQRSYGVCWSGDAKEGSFHYLAGVAVEGTASLPAGFERKTLAAQDYAVFRITLDGSNLHSQMQAAMPKIWGDRKTKSGHKFAPAPDLEVYPEDFDPTRKGSYVDIYVPVTV